MDHGWDCPATMPGLVPFSVPVRGGDGVEVLPLQALVLGKTWGLGLTSIEGMIGSGGGEHLYHVYLSLSLLLYMYVYIYNMYIQYVFCICICVCVYIYPRDGTFAVARHSARAAFSVAGVRKCSMSALSRTAHMQ